jgi:hypothetical protein
MSYLCFNPQELRHHLMAKQNSIPTTAAMHNDGGQTTANDARPWRAMRDDGGGRCTMTADNAQRWQTIHDEGG